MLFEGISPSEVRQNRKSSEVEGGFFSKHRASTYFLMSLQLMINLEHVSYPPRASTIPHPLISASTVDNWAALSDTGCAMAPSSTRKRVG